MADDIIKLLLDTGEIVEIMSAQDARDFDTYTIQDVGIKSELLMEVAGHAVAETVIKAIGQEPLVCTAVLVFVGQGNNGADAVVASRHLLSRGIISQIFFLADEEKWTDELRFQVTMLKNALSKAGIDSTRLLKAPDSWSALTLDDKERLIVIDGIFGAGLNRAPSKKPLEAITLINHLRETHRNNIVVVSVDIPSGLSMDAEAGLGANVVADITVTFGHLKRAHISEPTKAMCGLTIASPIGIFAKNAIKTFYRKKQQALTRLFSAVSKTAHKGQFGHVLVLEGNQRYLGASRLAARAALRVGAGLVTIATDKRLLPTAFDLPEFMRIKRHDIDALFMKRIDAVVIGPGLSAEDYWQREALGFINDCGKNIPFLVLDADALRLLKNHELEPSAMMVVATPHPKEAADLLGVSLTEVEANRFKAIEALGALSKTHGHEVIWVLKGATTLVRAIDGALFAFRGSLPILSAGGSGDVLSGTIAGLARQTDSPLASVLLAVSIQINAGRFLSKRIFKGSLASELADIFPYITRHRR